MSDRSTQSGNGPEQGKGHAPHPMHDAEAGQRDVVEFLSTPDAYATPSSSAGDQSAHATGVQLISTHSAHVFLAGDEVYKIKRAVTYSYLDMASLQTRERLCRRELELNRPILPQIYLELVAITRTVSGELQLGGHGTVVEWAVHMKRFDEHLVLDNIAKAGHLDRNLAGKAGRSIAEYHRSLDSECVSDGYARIAEVVHELIHELGICREYLDDDRLSAFERSGLQELARCASLLNQRAADGFVKRCHGDLHLRNLVLIDGVPVPFDALEFDERMATTDVLYDLAFLIMDLQFNHLPEQANHALNQYLLHSDVSMLAGLDLLPLFLFCRAGIRAMTTAQAAALARTPLASMEAEPCAYLDLALNYLDRPKPLLLVLGGLSGTGKSTLGSRLAPALPGAAGAVMLRSDSLRKILAGVEETSTLPESHYTPATSRQVYTHMLERTVPVLRSGQSVIVDAVFLDSDEREKFEQCARDMNTEFMGIWLHAPAEVLKKRVAGRRNDASDATVRVLERQLKINPGDMSWCPVDTTGTPEDVLEKLTSLLNATF